MPPNNLQLRIATGINLGQLWDKNFKVVSILILAKMVWTDIYIFRVYVIYKIKGIIMTAMEEVLKIEDVTNC